MNPTGKAILDHLATVEKHRTLRTQDAPLGERVQAIKAYQHRRFQNTYADLLRQKRYERATTFFLEELYGPHDFTQRDQQFARIVPALVRLFPSEIVRTVEALAALHALSESLDTQMAMHLEALPVDRPRYAAAWQATGLNVQREQQIQLMLDVGHALEGYTRNPLLRHSLKLMRGPARTAGLGALQAFLEEGFDTFGAMNGAGEFLDSVATRERALAKRLDEVDVVTLATGESPALHDPLGQLP